MKFPNKPECREGGSGSDDSEPDGSGDEEDSSNIITIVLVIVGLIAVGVGIFYYYNNYMKKRNTGINTSGSNPAGSANIKYEKPLSDPLFRL